MYDTVQIKKSFLSDEMKKQLDAVKGKKQKEELEMKFLTTLTAELNDEEETVKSIGASFAAFLKVFAIVPYNDAMGEMIDIQIGEQETSGNKNAR